MKKFLIHTFFTPKFLGPVASFATGLAAAWAVSALPGAPEFVTVALDMAMDVVAGRAPEVTPGDVITQAELMAFLGPIIAYGVSWAAQRLVASDTNRMLGVMKDNGAYDGPIDAWPGDVAFKGVVALVEAMKKSTE